MLMDLHIRSEIAPLSARASEDMAELDALGIQESGIIECASRHCSDARNRLQGHPQVGSAPRAEIGVQPPSGLVRDVVVAGQGDA